MGEITLPGVVPKFDKHPGAIRSAGPALGEHTDEVLASLGLDADAIAGLRERGVI